MMNKLKHSATIEQYLNNEMTAVEKEGFERELSVNPDLEEEYILSLQINKALLNEDVIDLRAKLLKVIRESKHVKQETIIIRHSFNKWWYAAASLLILAAVAATLLIKSNIQTSPDNLFNKYYSSENIIDITRSGNGSIVEAVAKFQQKDYAMASKLFSQVLENDESNMAVWFYLGIASIETENFSKAEKAFNIIINDQNNLYIEHAEWFLALTYLKQNKMDLAKSEFRKIADNPDNFHRQNAIHILNQLQ